VLILLHKSPCRVPPALPRLEARTLGVLVEAPTDENLESPMYASCSKTIEF
jgi:hypothetical protein